MMRCKVGDLAVIVSSTYAPQHIGKVVTCVRLHIFDGIEFWEIEKPLDNPRGIPYWAVADRRLFPIRDPGDDARDETLSWLQVPGREEVTA